MADKLQLKTFSWMLDELKKGESYARVWWIEDYVINIQKPSLNSDMSVSYIYIRNNYDSFQPYTPTQADLLAEDWHRVY